MEREIVGDEERFARQRRDPETDDRRDRRNTHARHLGLPVLHRRDEAIVRRSLMVVMKPVMERGTRAGERREQQQEHQQPGENRFAERAPSRRCS